MNKLFSSKRYQKGVTLIEYALIAALIAVVSILILTNLGVTLQGTFASICSQLPGAVSCAVK